MQKHSRPGHLYDAYLIDLDGTVYLGGERLLPGARETLDCIRAFPLARYTSARTFAAQPAGQPRRVIFLTNEASRPRSFFAGRLQRLGIPAEPEDILNASTALVELVRRRLPGGRLFVIGEPPLRAELEAAGFSLVDDPRQVQAVIASNDHSFDYRKLKVAFEAIRLGALFFATNADRVLLLPGGALEPDAAPIIAAIEACTGHPLDGLAGKPAVWMADAALTRLGLPPGRCLVVGDNLETDIAMGVQAGTPTALVLSGVSGEADLAASPVQPTYVIRELSELIPEG